MHPDRAVAALVAEQHGVLSHEQAVSLGFTKRMIEHRVATGRWERLARGVYLLAGADRGFLTTVRAATLLSPRSAASGRTAAAIHRLTSFRPGPVEVTVAPPASTTNPLATVHRRSDVDTTRVTGVPVTTIARTVADLCGTRIATSTIERAVDDAILERRVHLGHLEDQAVLHTRLRSPGVNRLRSIVEARADGAAVAQSALEPLLWALVDHPLIPPAVRQFHVPWTVDGNAGFADLYIERWALILEADGRRWHTRIADFERDRRRDRAALACGLAVVRFSWTDLADDLARSRSQLLAIGRRRAAELGLG